ncbi:MAG: PASTA domain-containing protein [Acidimicrobiales bacterium]|nr:PASTA domain-containing protein [Acidimicrobiales bacterium]
MAKDPDHRYGSAEELRADLLRFADGRPVQAADPGITSMMETVGTTRAVPVASRTTAVPLDGGSPPADPDELERKKRTRRLIILLVALLVALGVIAYFLLRAVGVIGGTVTVPNVVGDSQSAAVQTLKNDSLTVGTTSFRTSAQAKGIVLSTSPAAGASVSKNSAVNLVVSNGPNIPIVTVPSVDGKQLTAAISAIQGAGLNYRVNDVTSTQPVGTVISQSPAGGTKVRATVPVVLTVSSAQSSVPVPSVLGQSPASAGATLRGDGLNVGSQGNACSSQYQSGVVSSQSPAPGINVPPNTPVNLVISTGNCVQVPGVVGQSASSAQSAITGAGLVANQTSDTTCPGGAQPGNVDSQTPAAGTQVNSGTTVTISICQSTTTTSATTTPSSTTSTSSSTTTSHAVHRRGGG